MAPGREKKGSDVISPLDAPTSGFGQRPWLLSQHPGLSETLRRTLRTELLGWILVGDAGLAIAAAASGHGRARVPVLLAEAAIAAGQVRALEEARPCRKGYWLVAPLPQWRQKKAKELIGAIEISS